MKHVLGITPLLIWLLLLLYIFDLVAVIINRISPSPALIAFAIFFSMLSLVAYIISYEASRGKFKQRERNKLKIFFMPRRKGRLHLIIRNSRHALMTFLLAMLMIVVEANKFTGIIFVFACVSVGMVIVEYYFLHQREISQEHRARGWKILVVCFTGSLFVANMFASQFILEAFDIDPAKLIFTRWSFSLIVMLLLVPLETWFVLMFFGAFFRVVRRSRRQAMMTIFDPLTLTCVVAAVSLLMLVPLWWSAMGNTLIGYFYHFDTRSTFSCQQRDFTIMPFGDNVGYIQVSEGKYRAIYKKHGVVAVARVTCLPDGTFTWSEIKYASEINRQNIRPQNKPLTPDNKDPARSNHG